MKYEVTSPVDHDGTRFEIGEPIELDKETAAALLKVKAIKEIPAGSQPTGSDVRIEAVKDAIAKLDPEDKASGLQSGLPDLAAIEAVLGWPPAAAERDAAWAEYQQGVA
jgi:hypothetical protein